MTSPFPSSSVDVTGHRSVLSCLSHSLLFLNSSHYVFDCKTFSVRGPNFLDSSLIKSVIDNVSCWYINPFKPSLFSSFPEVRVLTRAVFFFLMMYVHLFLQRFLLNPPNRVLFPLSRGEPTPGLSSYSRSPFTLTLFPMPQLRFFNLSLFLHPLLVFSAPFPRLMPVTLFVFGLPLDSLSALAFRPSFCAKPRVSGPPKFLLLVETPRIFKLAPYGHSDSYFFEHFRRRVSNCRSW